MKTAGIFGGTSWTSTIEYYRVLNQAVHERLGGDHSMKLVLWSVNFAEHLAIHEYDGWDGVANEVIEAARRLKAAGADFLMMAANTLHGVADEVEDAVDLPLLHIADATAGAIRNAGMDRVGLLGTRHTMNEDFYRVRLKERHGIDVIVPGEDDRAEIDRIIWEELVMDRYEEPARVTCIEVIGRLAAEGARGVILGCTELPRLVAGAQTAVPTFDTLQIHAEAAVDLALEGGEGG